MRPYPEEVLRAIQSGIVSHFAPELTSKYGQAQFAFSMLLFAIVTRDYDTAVPDLVEGNTALRELLAETATSLATIDRSKSGDARSEERAAALAVARLALGALPEPAASLRLSALRAEHEALCAIVATLAPVIEPAADVPALVALAPVRTRIYAHFAADARRRIFPILTA